MKEWERGIPLVDLIPLFHVNGQIGMAMKIRFTVISVCTSEYLRGKHNSFPRVRPSEGMLSSNDIKVAHDYSRPAL